ncbi:MAG: hypothetical protein JNM68_07195 [Dinghuibacter sp.]|nr:hypothetical protein [Dinghuibacter sp.]
MKKNLKKIELRKKTVSLLNRNSSQIYGGLTGIADSCRKQCPTLQPDCGLSIQPNSCMQTCACLTVGWECI